MYVCMYVHIENRNSTWNNKHRSPNWNSFIALFVARNENYRNSKSMQVNTFLSLAWVNCIRNYNDKFNRSYSQLKVRTAFRIAGKCFERYSNPIGSAIQIWPSYIPNYPTWLDIEIKIALFDGIPISNKFLVAVIDIMDDVPAIKQAVFWQIMSARAHSWSNEKYLTGPVEWYYHLQ